jgi:hypothetical protein
MDENITPRLTIAEVQTEAEDILIAGSDTTATTLTYACVHLARKPYLWEKLYQEIKPVYGDPGIIRESKVLEPLALLTACIKESKLESCLEQSPTTLVKITSSQASDLPHLFHHTSGGVFPTGDIPSILATRLSYFLPVRLWACQQLSKTTIKMFSPPRTPSIHFAGWDPTTPAVDLTATLINTWSHFQKAHDSVVG